MSSGRREGRNSEDGGTHIPQRDEMLTSGVEECGVSDTKRTAELPRDSYPPLDRDVESDALMSSAADERSCCQPDAFTGRKLSPSVRTKDGRTLSALQETLSTNDTGVYCMRTVGTGRSTVGENVMVTSTGGSGTSNWNSTVVMPVDDQRTSKTRLPATSPQVRVKPRSHRARQIKLMLKIVSVHTERVA